MSILGIEWKTLEIWMIISIDRVWESKRSKGHII